MNKLSWLLPEFIKQRLCRYLLQNYLGHLFEEKINLEQLEIDIFNGTATLKNIKLDCTSLNEQLISLDLPFEITSGQIGQININIPWHKLVSESCKLEVKDLCIVIRPKKAVDVVGAATNNDTSTTASMFQSMFLNSQHASMEIAKECLLKNDERYVEEGDTFEFETSNMSSTNTNLMGLEAFAHTIDSILGRIQVSIEHTIIRLEHILVTNENNYSNGIALEFHIKSIRYFDSDVQEQQNQQQQRHQNHDPSNRPTFSIKNFIVEGLTVYCDEFLIKEKTKLTNMSTSFYASSASSNDSSTSSTHESCLSLQTGLCYVYTQPFICATFSGQQKLEINIQKSFLNEAKSRPHNLAIPKIELCGHFGSIEILLCPKQLHLIIKMISAFVETSRHGEVNTHSLKQRPIRGLYQQRFESLLQTNLSQRQMNESTSTFVNDERVESVFSSIYEAASNTDDDELTTTPKNSPPKSLAFSLEEKMSSVLNDDTSSLSSSYTRTPQKTNKTSTQQQPNKKSTYLANEIQNILKSPNFECITMNFKVNMLSITLLHEDPTSENGSMLGDCMKNASEKYYDLVSTILTSGYLSELRQKFVESCSSYNHFLLICKPIDIKIISKTEKDAFNLTDFVVTIGFLDLIEYLTHNKLVSEMIGFDVVRQKQSHMTSGNFDSCFKLKYTSYIPVDSISTRNKSSFPCQVYNQLCLTSNHLVLDLDISIIDRLVHLIPSTYDNTSNKPQSVYLNEISNDLFNFTLSCPNLKIILRFPIADLRDTHTRASRWTKQIRKQALTLQLNDFNFKHESTVHDLIKTYLIQCGQLNAYYKLNDEQNEFLFGSLSQVMSNLVECEVLIRDTRPSLDEDHQIEHFSNGPFSSITSLISTESSRQVKNPADRAEMNMFIAQAKCKSELLISLNIPSLKFLISDYEFLNDIYNRLVNDILMWEPMPLPEDNLRINLLTHEDTSLYFSTSNKFEMCKSFMMKKIDEDFDESEVASTTATTTQRQPCLDQNCLNKVCFVMNVNHGHLKAFVDSNTDYGEFDLSCGNFNLCVVSGERGDVNKQLICIYSDEANLKHFNDTLVSKSQFFPIDQDSFDFIFNDTKCKDLIVKNTLATSLFEKSQDKPMLSLAIESNLNPSSKPKQKHILLALNINDACLKHLFVQEDHFWLFQLLKLFKFEDIEITGYEAPVAITELHLSVTNSSIDYRPLNLNTRALVGFKCLRLTSNVVAQASNQTLLVFNIDDIYLFLSNQKVPLNREFNLRFDYVCVMYSNFFEFRLLINDSKETHKSQSALDVKLKCNIIQVRTCIDSCFSLIELLSYIVADGDLLTRLSESQISALETQTISNQATITNANLGKNDTTSSNISNLVDDAMSQSVPFGGVFNSEMEAQLDMENEYDEDYDERDNKLISEFDIIDMIPGLGETPRNGDYSIKYLDDTLNDSLNVDANHFSKPKTKIDVLKAPDHYPTPQCTYCVEEITIVWSLFGGYDMMTHDVQHDYTHTEELSSVSFSCSAKSEYDVRSMRSRATKDDTSLSISPKSRVSMKSLSSEKCLPSLAGGRLVSKYDAGKSLNWIMRGAKSRRIDQSVEISCSKIKAKVDVYDETLGNLVNRFALAIGDIKIEDNVCSSAFRTFLYKYESDARLKHTNTNILLMKMLFTRSADEHRLLECDVRLSMQPLRFNIDQDALLFMVDYFKSLLEREIKFDHLVKTQTKATAPVAQPKSEQQTPQVEQRIYIKNFTFAPDLLIKFDITGKYDTRPNSKLSNLTNVLLMLTLHFSNTEIKLKKVFYKRGFLGVDKLVSCLVKDWLTDIQKNQVKNIIKGLGLFNSFIKFFEGFANLFWYPIEQYRKDGRVLYGLKKGSTAFSTNTVLATIELTNRILQLTKNVAEFFYDLVTPQQVLRIGFLDDNSTLVLKNRNIRERRQPNDIREGLTNAYNVICEGLNDTAINFVNEINSNHESTGIAGAIGGVFRQLPSATLTPIVLTTEAACNVLSGLRNQLNPDEKRDDELKWKTVI